jgi:hypothetical protein
MPSSSYRSYFKQIILGILLLVGGFTLHSYLKSSRGTNPTSIEIKCGDLINDLRHYKTTDRTHHSGDLLEHSIWVARIIEQWFAQNNEWCNGIDRDLIKTLTLAGLLHDIGKGGDLKAIYFKKEKHPEIGFSIIRGTHKYRTHPHGKPFDFDHFFENNQIDSQERALIAVLAGIHWDFGGMLMRDVQSKSRTLDQACKAFLDKLHRLAKQARYNNGHLDDQLIRCAILIGAADVKGSSYVPCSCYDQCTLPDIKAPHPAENMYDAYGYETIGKAARQSLLSYAAQHGYLAE